MVVRQDDGRRVVPECGLEHFTRVDGGAIKTAPRQFFKCNHAMTGIEEQDREHLVRQIAQTRLEVITRRMRILQRVTLRQRFCQMASRPATS